MHNLGAIVVLALVLGGLVWLGVRSFKGKEVNRKLIFLFILVSVAAPLLVTIKFDFKPTPIVDALFDKIESLPPGSRVLISYDFDPAMAPEVQPMADVVTRHCLQRRLKVVFMSLWATGQGQLAFTLDNVLRKDFPNLVDGTDYVVFGYKAGNEGVLNVIVTDFEKMFPTDANSVPYDSILMAREIKSCKDFGLILSFGGGRPGLKEWVQYVGDPADVPTAGGVAAVSAPQLYPYYPRQMLGMLGGIKGAAEYESRLMKQYPQFSSMATPAIVMMGPQTVAHVVIMALIIIGNIQYFAGRRKKGGSR
jgi:hypothetical protein